MISSDSYRVEKPLLSAHTTVRRDSTVKRLRQSLPVIHMVRARGRGARSPLEWR